jgi:dihydropteroate synthase
MIRVLQPSNQEEIKKIMQGVRVDPYGIEIMLPKTDHYLIRIGSISNMAANILKQEMLSLGGDVAIAREALTGRLKKTDCLIIGNLAQFSLLKQKLNRQPFGLNRLASDLNSTLENYNTDRFMLDLGRFKINLKGRTYIMGIVNLTSDSFSGDGLYRQGLSPKGTAPYVEQLIKDGADIIDIGGESTRPGARPVSVKEEINRVIPVIKLLAKKIKVPISIDTYKPEVAQQALDNGAVIVNDITGLRNPKIIKLVVRYKAGAVIMHMKGNPRTMQNNPVYKSLIEELIEFFDFAIKRVQDSGIAKEKIIIDPGVGFGKTLEHNLKILKRLSEFRVLGRPILVGTSRKSFIGKILNIPPKERLFGTIASSLWAVKSGAKIVRVHDVKAVKQALSVADAINGASLA